MSNALTLIHLPLIHDYIKLHEGFGAQHIPYMHRLLKLHGVGFVPSERPKHIKKMRNGECFHNASKMADKHDLIYVEGFAMSVIPIHHAWCVDSDGAVIDPTWQTAGTEYFGIPFDPDYCRKVALESGFYGILDNYRSRDIYTAEPDEFLYKGEKEW